MAEREIACSYTREVLDLLGAHYRKSPEATRAVFFEKLLRTGAQRLKAAQWGDELIEELYLATPSEQLVHCDSDARRDLLNSIPEVPEQLASTPELMGWCFQIWNEPVRNAQTWAVSRREEALHESAELGTLTQLFTDEYLADLLIGRCLSLLLEQRSSGTPKMTICDPACGVGHILMAAVRRCSQESPCPDWIGTSLFGFDIDPSAVAVARGLVFLQAFACGFSGDGGRLLHELRRAIVALSQPYGTLQRGALDEPRSGFDVVVTNPPYLGRRKMSSGMRAFLDREYPGAKIDLCAAFMQRCVELCKPKGAIGFLTSDKWLRLRGYEVLRNGSSTWKGILGGLSLDLVLELGAKAFHPSVQLHDGVKATVLCARNDRPPPEHQFQYSNVTTLGSYSDKVQAVQQLAHRSADSAAVFRIAQRDWRDCGTASVFLQVSGLPKHLLESSRVVAQKADVVVGIQTSDDAHYVRYVWQVPALAPGWRIHSKGGGYARWCGLNRWVIDWQGGAHRFFRTERAREAAERWANRDGWCYTWFANGSLGLRSKAAGWSFGRAAASGVFCDDLRLIAFLNSRFASVASRAIGGKVQLPEGVVRALPIPATLTEIAAELVSLAQGIKCELARGDIADAFYAPQLSRDLSQSLALEALVLVVEGVLEAQVERAVGLNQDQSKRWGKEHGVPVGWLPPMHEVLSHPVWSCVPDRLRGLRCVLAAYADTVPTPIESLASKRALVAGHQLPLKVYPVRYVLPSTGIVEHLSRLYQVHPFDVVGLIMDGSNALKFVAEELHVSNLSVEVTREMMRALGHSWWSDPAYALNDAPDSLNHMDLCAVVERCAQELGCGHLLKGDVSTWVRRELIAWQAKRFLGASPLLFSETSRGELTCSHVWLQETKSGSTHTTSLTRISSEYNAA